MEGKLNIAMFGHKRIPSREGGIEIVVEEIATRLARMGHQVTCYNRAGHHVSREKFDTEKISAYKGVRLKTVPTIEKKGFAAVTSSFFAAVVTAFGKYDAVHTFMRRDRQLFVGFQSFLEKELSLQYMA